MGLLTLVLILVLLEVCVESLCEGIRLECLNSEFDDEVRASEH